MQQNKEKRKPLTREAIEAKREALNKSRGQYDVMKTQFENFKDVREDEFKTNMKNIISEDDLEKIWLESDPVKVFEIFKKYEQEYVEDAIEEKRDDLEAFEDKLHEDTQALDAMEIEAQFAEKNPDLDFEGMLSHLQENMSPAKIKELLEKADGDNLAYLVLVRDDFLGKKDPDGDGDADGDKDDDGDGASSLPTDLDGIAGETGDVDGDSESENDEDYLSRVGLG